MDEAEENLVVGARFWCRRWHRKVVRAFQLMSVLVFVPKQKKIVSELERVTGLSFKQKEINIWLIKGLYPTTPNPNLLNIEKEDDIIVFDFIYLLAHILLAENDFYDKFINDYGIDERKLEAIVYIVTKKSMKKVTGEQETKRTITKLQKDVFAEYLWKDVTHYEKTIAEETPLANIIIEDLKSRK